MTSPDKVDVNQADEQKVTRQQWKWSVLAGMASYLDAGSIVALGSGLAVYQGVLGLSDSAVGILAAIGPNAIGAALGALLGGRLGDRLGRKRIYKYDLLVYALGALCVAVSVNAPMLFVGTFIVGVSVGADVPTSLALVGEFSPTKARGKLLGFTQIAWYLGPAFVLVIALVLAPLGLLGIRIVFAHLVLVSLVTWALRRGLAESARWRAAAATGSVRANMRALFAGKNLRAMLWTGAIYLFWNLAAGTAGIFTPYMVRSLGAGDQATSVAIQCAGFTIGIIAMIVLFMPLSDRSHRIRKTLWGLGAIMQIVAYLIYLVFPFTVPVIVTNIVLANVGGAIAGESFYKVFSQELFPTVLRGTAQGITFGAARVILGIWSFFVPVLAATGIGPVAAVLSVFLLLSGIIGFVFMPNTVGKSLEQIESERGTAMAG